MTSNISTIKMIASRLPARQRTQTAARCCQLVSQRNACTWNRARGFLGETSRIATGHRTPMSSCAPSSSSGTAAHSTTVALTPGFLIQQQAALILNAASASSSSSSISRAALHRHFLAAAIPMVGFGFMDNFVMIQAGQYIDNTLGVQLGLATMTAAAAGQVVSDVSGVLFGGTLERLAAHLFPRTTNSTALTAAQRQLPLAKNVALAGAVLGVIVGCALGATTLLLVDLEARDRLQNTQHLRDIVSDMIATAQQQQQTLTQQHTLLNNNNHSLPRNVLCTVHVASDHHFTMEENDDNDQQETTRVSLLQNASSPVVHQCAEQQEVLVAAPSSSSSADFTSICAPIRLADGTVLGVLELQLLPDNESSFLEQNNAMQTAKLMGQHLGIVVKHLLE